ncbi:MAG: DMT family transporter [Bacteroidota bacterium]
MNSNLFNVLQLIFGLCVMSSSGVLGRYIHLPPPVTIWLRSIIAAVALFVILKMLRKSTFIGWGKHFRIVFFSSLLLAAHWITYFTALQLSTVAIAMLSMFTYPIMTAFLEPLLLKTRFDKMTVLLSIIAVIGVFFLTPDLNLDNSITQGVFLGLLSGLLYGLRNILLKKNINEHSGITLMYYQMIIITILLIPVFYIYDIDFSQQVYQDEWEALLILGIATTSIGHTLFVVSFKHFTVTTVSILSCLTPLLGTFLGFLILDEVPKGQTFVAGALILLTAGFESYRSVQPRKKNI